MLSPIAGSRLTVPAPWNRQRQMPPSVPAPVLDLWLAPACRPRSDSPSPVGAGEDSRAERREAWGLQQGGTTVQLEDM